MFQSLSLPAHCAAVGLCGRSCPQQEEASGVMAEQGTDLSTNPVWPRTEMLAPFQIRKPSHRNKLTNAKLRHVVTTLGIGDLITEYLLFTQPGLVFLHHLAICHRAPSITNLLTVFFLSSLVAFFPLQASLLNEPSLHLAPGFQWGYKHFSTGSLRYD